jgi:peptidoglycan/LPS O-acetylase OafA/YrhL
VVVLLSLPLAGLLVGPRPPGRWLALGAVSAAAGGWWISAHAGWPIAAAFLGGIAAALLARSPRLGLAARHPAASVVCLAALFADSRFATPFDAAPLLCLAVAFAIIACGNSLFGVLNWDAARGLGEMGYSVYLLHAVVLYVTFGLMLGTERTVALSGIGFWSVVYACGLTVVVVSFVTFRTIEAPAMRSVDRVNALAAP